MEKVKELIDAGDLEAAKRFIIDKEAELSEEPSVHAQCLLKRQIVEMKNLYLSKMEIALGNTKERGSIDIDIYRPVFERSNRKCVISNLNHTKVGYVNCSEAKIENCSGIAVELVDSANSILITNVKNSEIKCRASQVRLIGCQDVSLILFTKTGVFLQDSKGIAIRPLSSESGNLYKSVFDFTDPSGHNYTVLDPFL